MRERAARGGSRRDWGSRSRGSAFWSTTGTGEGSRSSSPPCRREMVQYSILVRLFLCISKECRSVKSCALTALGRFAIFKRRAATSRGGEENLREMSGLFAETPIVRSRFLVRTTKRRVSLGRLADTRLFLLGRRLMHLPAVYARLHKYHHFYKSPEPFDDLVSVPGSDIPSTHPFKSHVE